MNCILAHNQTTPEKTLSNPFHGKGFCEVNQYKAAIERCEGGYKSCEIGIEIYKDLVKILQHTSDALRHWSNTSQKHIIQSKEFGTTRKSWITSIQAIEKLADRHADIVKNVQENVVNEMAKFKSKQYGKSFLQVKNIKQFEKEFKKTQKPWLQLLEKVADAKQAYHDARRQLRGVENAERVTQSDVGASDEEKKKNKSSVENHKTECETYRTKYEKVIQEVNKTKPTYEEEMFKILKRTDEFERERMEHFRATFTALKEATSLEKDKRHSEMMQTFKQSLDTHDIADDIKYFNTHYGRDTNTKWPTFEEFSE